MERCKVCDYPLEPDEISEEGLCDVCQDNLELEREQDFYTNNKIKSSYES